MPQSGQKQREDQRCLSEGRIDRNQRKYGRKEGANGQNSDRGEEPPKETSERGTSENRHKESHRYGWSLKSLHPFGGPDIFKKCLHRDTGGVRASCAINILIRKAA